MNRELCLVVGCGAENSARLGVSPEKIIALDSNMKILKRYQSVSLVSMVVCADAGHLPFADDTIASVQETHILEHLDHDYSVKAVGEVNRVLLDGGQAIFAVPHPNFDNILATIDDIHHSNQMHRQLLSGDELGKMVTDSGLKIVESKIQNGKQAIELIIIGMLHRFRPDLMARDEQTGYRSVIVPNTPNKSLLKDLVKKTLLIFSYCLSPLIDRIIPYESVVIARKEVIGD